MSGAARVTVRFEPGCREARLQPGESLLRAAWQAGVAIKSVCGGHGQCGSCVVEVDPADGGHLGPCSEEESALLPNAPPAGSYRLACLATAEHDLTVRVPPESEAVRSPPRKPYTVSAVAARPVVRRQVFAAEPLPEGGAAALATRLARGLGSAAASARLATGGIAPGVLAALSRHSGFDRAGEFTATIGPHDEVLQILPGRHDRLMGVAVDIGTTSIVVFVCDLATATIAAVRTAANPQGAWGEDVIARMTHIQRDPALLERMRGVLATEINTLVRDAAAEIGVAVEDIVDVVAVGNPTMQHILLGINPEPIGRGPYLPLLSAGCDIEAARAGLAFADGARLHVLPMVSGYIGGDTLAALLTRNRDFDRGIQLLVDVGTNGEVVLARDGTLTATSCATGPVYEGAHIQCGVRACPGAIERVWSDDGRKLRWAAIPDPTPGADRRPVGLCGSGVISAMAAMVAAGALAPDGAFVPGHAAVRTGRTGTELLLVPGPRSRTGRDIVITQADVRNVQLGKAALRAGIEILMQASGVERLDRIHLAGTFGNHLDPADILAIGMVPPIAVERIRSIGNAAGDGARMALFDRHARRRAQRLADRIRVVELTTRADFQDAFVRHTELSPQPAALE